MTDKFNLEFLSKAVKQLVNDSIEHNATKCGLFEK